MNCPKCKSTHTKRNGHIHTGKQNYRCNDCGRQFVANSEKKYILEPEKKLINKLLLERISLSGIARTIEVSETWLNSYISELYSQQPDDLCAHIPTQQAMEQHLEQHFDEHVYQIEALKKTLHRLSLKTHGKILNHLTLV